MEDIDAVSYAQYTHASETLEKVQKLYYEKKLTLSPICQTTLDHLGTMHKQKALKGRMDRLHGGMVTVRLGKTF